jgi:TolA-binding protein
MEPTSEEKDNPEWFNLEEEEVLLPKNYQLEWEKSQKFIQHQAGVIEELEAQLQELKRDIESKDAQIFLMNNETGKKRQRTLLNRCQGVNNRNKPCKSYCIENSKFCLVHSNEQANHLFKK